MNCGHCDGSGFVNFGNVPEGIAQRGPDSVRSWLLTEAGAASDVAVCDCCGDGMVWHGEAGQHDERDFGPEGPYAGNGGRPRCS